MLSCRAPISFTNTATLKLRRKRTPHQTKSVHWICNLNTVVRLEDRFWVNVVAPLGGQSAATKTSVHSLTILNYHPMR